MYMFYLYLFDILYIHMAVYVFLVCGCVGERSAGPILREKMFVCPNDWRKVLDHSAIVLHSTSGQTWGIEKYYSLLSSLARGVGSLSCPVHICNTFQSLGISKILRVSKVCNEMAYELKLQPKSALALDVARLGYVDGLWPFGARFH